MEKSVADKQRFSHSSRMRESELLCELAIEEKQEKQKVFLSQIYIQFAVDSRTTTSSPLFCPFFSCLWTQTVKVHHCFSTWLLPPSFASFPFKFCFLKFVVAAAAADVQKQLAFSSNFRLAKRSICFPSLLSASRFLSLQLSHSFTTTTTATTAETTKDTEQQQEQWQSQLNNRFHYRHWAQKSRRRE